uniref:Uncharacterized protein n=1 Tax=Arundo donax TaxID=35708 RepID=A0A0A9HJT5_ARUDO
MASDEVPVWRGYGACWRGAFFVQGHGGSTVIRISLSNDNYRVIKVPTDIGLTECGKVYLGRSGEGVCCASFLDWFKFQVWKHQIDFKHTVSRVLNYCQRIEGPWILQDANNGVDYGQQILQDVNHDEDDNNSALMNQKFEWDSDNDNVLDDEYEVEQTGYVTCLGFHPYKAVVFLNVSLSKAVAYHLNTSMVQVLGNVCPEYYEDFAGLGAHILSSFPYTPCSMAEFPENKFEEAHDED